MGNEFQEQADSEQKRVQAGQISEILELVRNQAAELKATRKELRTVRKELRNLDKLRPLREADEEEANQEAAPEVAEEATQA